MPTGLPTADWAKVVDREMASMTAPVAGSMGEPAWTARVPKAWTGVGGRTGVVTGSEVTGGVIVEVVVVRKRLGCRRKSWVVMSRQMRSGLNRSLCAAAFWRGSFFYAGSALSYRTLRRKMPDFVEAIVSINTQINDLRIHD
jgi:hypothetical protein